MLVRVGFTHMISTMKFGSVLFLLDENQSEDTEYGVRIEHYEVLVRMNTQF